MFIQKAKYDKNKKNNKTPKNKTNKINSSVLDVFSGSQDGPRQSGVLKSDLVQIIEHHLLHISLDLL